MSISLLISVFNRSDYLIKCLASVKCQSIFPDEIIICDDGSSEDIETVLKNFAEKIDIPITYVRQENKGFRLARNRNNGIKNASGDVLLFVDSDLIFTRNYIKSMKENIKPGFFLTSYPIRLTKEQTEKIDLEKIENYTFFDLIESKQIEKIKKQYRKDLFHYLLNFIIPRRFRIQPKLRGGACAIFRRELLNLNGYDENYIGWGNEDDNLNRRLYMSGVLGYNPSFEDFPIHLWHEPYHGGKRDNLTYHNKVKSEIVNGNIRCLNGIDRAEDLSDPVIVKKIKTLG